MRIFMALEISNKKEISHYHSLLCDCIIKYDSMSNFKPVREEHFHITILFIGETTSNCVNNIISQLSNFKFTSVEISFDKLGGFPKEYAAKNIWLGLDIDSMRDVVALYKRVLNHLNIDVDESFSPHLTLFRLKRGNINLLSLFEKQCSLKTLLANRPITCMIEKIQVKESILTSQGPMYNDLYTIYAG